MVVPKTKANREVRSSPRTRPTIKEPVRINVARAIFTFCIEPLSCFGTNVPVSGACTAGRGLLGTDKGRPGRLCGTSGAGADALTSGGAGGARGMPGVGGGTGNVGAWERQGGGWGVSAFEGATGGIVGALNRPNRLESDLVFLPCIAPAELRQPSCTRRKRSARNCCRRVWRSTSIGCEGCGALKY